MYILWRLAFSIFIRLLPARFSWRLLLLGGLAIIALGVAYPTARYWPARMRVGMPDCSKPSRGKRGSVILDRWHFYHDTNSNTYSLVGCLSNRTERPLSSDDLRAQLSYFLANANSEEDDPTLEDATHDIVFAAVPPSEARPAVVRHDIAPGRVTDSILGIFQAQWSGQGETQAAEVLYISMLRGYAPPASVDPCAALPALKRDVIVGDLRLQRDPFGILQVEGCLRNNTQAAIDQLSLNYINADDTDIAALSIESLPVSLDSYLPSGETLYVRAPIPESDTDIILRSVSWRVPSANKTEQTVLERAISLTE
ncbi:MAG: hypothetical protein AAFX40_03655 [Cyanobacteria bacterium J06639_1]